ncbi:tetratricopeptide repeat protein [Streptomyces sp. NPDC059679]|uniref:tetratricopeptide repeat protein n=1 Tax=Streptomyces sp. NPDC059679 TaxID=3346903 RepID=UPI00369EE286
MTHGAFDDWQAMARTGLESARSLGDQRAQALIHETLGAMYKDSKRLTQAAEHHRAALDLRTRIGDWAGVAESANGLGVVHSWCHELAASRARLEQALALYRQYGPYDRTGVVLNNLGYAAAGLGEFDEAARLAHQAMTVYRETAADHYLHIDALRLLARAARKAGHHAEAEGHLTDATALLERTGPSVIEALLRLEQATLLREQNRHDQALEAYWACETLQRFLGSRLGQAQAYDGIGHTMRALGRLQEAIDFHTMAAHILRDPPQPWDLAQTLAHLADAHADNDQPEQARHHRAEALTLLAPFPDPQATALRQRLQQLIAE